MVNHIGSKIVRELIECSVIPEAYRDHLEDPDVKMVYYRWGGSWYRIQVKFLGGSCIALKHGLGYILGQYRPLVCVVWPFWWVERSNPLEEDFKIEIVGECTMAKLWRFTPERIMFELDMNEVELSRNLRNMYTALREHRSILEEAYNEGIEPSKLLEWLIDRSTSDVRGVVE
ncbi:MAG: hypothetical protein QXQ29_01195 [Candidatus Bathyarchaeia archaeon]